MADISFFFTNFSEHFFERDMWKVFQRWGRVLDVFISRKLNARNRRFGFVRFQGVINAASLERKLDAIWIGTWKLQVNLPKYRRKEVPRRDWNDNQRQERSRNIWQPKVQQKQVLSFAQVVSGEYARRSQESESVSIINVEMESPSWLEGCFVGSIKEVSCLQSIKESFVMGGFSLIRLRYLGESCVLLSCDVAGVLEKLIADNKDWFDGLFSSIVPWDGSFEIKERFVWVRCRGIPLQFWCYQCFINLGVYVGEVIQIDEATLKKETLEFARFRVKVSAASLVSLMKDFLINGLPCKVWFEEEVSVPDWKLNRFSGKWNGGYSEVDTEVGSEEGGAGGSLCDSVGFDYEEVPGAEVGEEATVQCKEAPFVSGMEYQLHGAAEFQESLRVAGKSKSCRKLYGSR